MLNAVKHLACSSNSIVCYASLRCDEASKMLHCVQHDVLFLAYSYPL